MIEEHSLVNDKWENYGYEFTFEEGFKEGVEHVVQYAKEKMEAEKK